METTMQITVYTQTSPVIDIEFKTKAPGRNANVAAAGAILRRHGIVTTGQYRAGDIYAVTADTITDAAADDLRAALASWKNVRRVTGL
jgi:hypothetical protein